MLALDKKAARYTWTATAVLLLLAIVYIIRKTLFVFVVAVLLAYLLSPLVNFLDRLLPGRRTRTSALAIAYVIFVGVLVLAGFEIGTRVVDQANQLVKTFPAMLGKWQEPSPSVPGGVNSLKAQVVERIREMISSKTGDFLSKLPQAGLKVLVVAGDLIYVVIVPILAFFFLKDGRELREHIVNLAQAGPRRELMDELFADVHLLLAHYMRALLILCVATFICYSIFFMIIGLPYAILLAALAFALEFIPMLGPLVAAVSIIIVAALNGYSVLLVVAFLGAYRMFQDYILSPHLMGTGVELHPLLVLFGVFAGAELAGIPGTFLSVPVLALVRILYRRLIRAREAARLSPVQPVQSV